MSRPKVKICCIGNLAEARLALAAGADALGLVSQMPSGPGVIDEALIAEIAAALPASADSFLLTARLRADEIVAQHRRCGTTTLQLVDAVPADELRRLRDALPGVRLVQVVHVTGEDAIAAAVAVAPLVDAILLDSGNPALAVKSLGGTGRTHDWRLSRRIRDANVAEAIAAVRPYGLDLCSSVRRDGALDGALLHGFFAAVKVAVSTAA